LRLSTTRVGHEASLCSLARLSRKRSPTSGRATHPGCTERPGALGSSPCASTSRTPSVPATSTTSGRHCPKPPITRATSSPPPLASCAPGWTTSRAMTRGCGPMGLQDRCEAEPGGAPPRDGRACVRALDDPVGKDLGATSKPTSCPSDGGSSRRTTRPPRPRVVRVGRRRREDEVLYLLKGSRVREYHQQNVAILGAPEGEVIEVAYNRRWVQEGISLEPGTDCAIVFGDSPYEYFVPIRFAALLRAEETDSRVTVVCKLGPFVRRGALEPLNERWNRPDRPLRPGDVFLFEDRNPRLGSPRGLAETEDAWRAAVAALRHNDLHARTSVARLHSVIGEGGRPVDDGQPVPVGSVVKATLEVRSPHLADEQLELLLDVDPRGAVELLDDPVVPANGMAELSMRVTASGPLSVGLAFSHEPLLSSRPRFDLVAESRERAPTVPAERHGVGDVSGVRSLTARLRRDAD